MSNTPHAVRATTISICVNECEAELIRQLAHREALSVSSFVRRQLLAEPGLRDLSRKVAAA
jgi:hypothetical protein